MRFLTLPLLLLLLPSMASAQDEARWRETLEGVVPAVVALKVTGVRDFDTEDARNSQGTGFVVDRENGWILTNRHMVHAGPVVVEATLENSEEIPLRAVYRDPVHDFGFYRYDPKDVAYMDLPELDLKPGAARVGQEIRVVGNDAGEKVSILDGTLARLDRNVPAYGRDSYNDFNTFYFQAASNTSGGSSGSPVVDIDGSVVALNAGGSRSAASSFYLPLDRAVRAFELLRSGQPVSRGTLQATFKHENFAELVRLGLPSELERELRNTSKEHRGGLVVSSLVPNGPADGVLRPGDVLIRVNGELMVEFVPLEAALDDAVGEPVSLQIVRGGRVLDVKATVGDLHAISPDTYLEFGRAVLHPLSYQRARLFNLPVGGVYVSGIGHVMATSGIPEGSVLTHVDGEAIPTLDDAERVLSSKADGQRVRIRFFTITDPEHPYEAVIVADRKWFAMRRCTRNDETGTWPCVSSPEPTTDTTQKPPGALILPPTKGAAAKVVSSLVRVDFDIPYPTAGVKDLNYVGVGTIVDTEQGLVLVDRDTVPVRLGDLMLTFGGAVRVPGTVKFLHPAHGFAIVQYDPDAVGDVPVSQVSFDEQWLDKGDKVHLIAMDRKQLLVDLKTTISTSETLELGTSSTPRFRESNLLAYNLSDAEKSLGGVITDRKGTVFATWSSFMDTGSGEREFRGLPARYIVPVVDALRRGEEPTVRVLGAELERLTLDMARDRGLSDERVLQFLEQDATLRTLFEVSRLDGLAPAKDVLRTTDLVLEMNGQLFTRISAVADLDPTVTFTVLRDGQEQTVTFETRMVGGEGIDRMVSWAGLIAHAPHYEVSAQRGIDPLGVYTSWLWFGSPAAREGVLPTRRILQVNDTTTPDLDTFIKVVRGLKNRESVRLTIEDLKGVTKVFTVKVDLNYWPTELLEFREDGWIREPIQ